VKTSRKLLGCVAAIALIGALTAGGSVPAATAGSAQASRATAGVNIHDFAFHPGTLKIAKGTKVVFSNTSGVAHTATRAGVFDTGRIKPGTSVSVRFAQKGAFPYHCKIHNFMHGKIVVG
jgi:plastocyanin